MEVSQLLNNNIINRQHALLLTYLRRNGRTSNREMSTDLGLPINVITPRNKELRDLGYIVPSRKIYDKITNRTVQTWDAA